MEETPIGRGCTGRSSVRVNRSLVFRMRISSQAAFPIAVFGLWRRVAPASAHRLLRVVPAYPGGARQDGALGYPHGSGGSQHMKHRVLIADDEEHARSGLATLVSGWGYEVEEAADGTEALARAGDFHPGVVIADVVMPGLDGMGLLKSLAEVEPAAAVIVLTGHATVENAVSAMKEGAYDYLTKPVDPER